MGPGFSKAQVLPEAGRGAAESPSLNPPSFQDARLAIPEIGKEIRSALMGGRSERTPVADVGSSLGVPTFKSAVYAEGGSIPSVEKAVVGAPKFEVPQMRSEAPSPSVEAGPRNEPPRMRENMVAKIVEYGERLGSRYETLPLKSSNASLDDFLRKVWDQRDTLGQLVAKGIGEVANELYAMYKKSEMPLLRTVTTESYLDGLAAIGHRAGPNVGPYLQDSPEGLSRRFLVNGSTTAHSPEQESFLGRTFYRFDRNESDYAFTTHKVYVRADPNHAIGLMDHVVSNILRNPEKYPGVAGAKVAGPDVVGERCDNFVIYLTDEAAAQRVIDNLNVYRTKHPLAFGPDTPPMSQPVAPGISIAHPDCSGPYKAEAIARVINDYMGRGSRLHRDVFSSHEIPATYGEFKGRVEASLKYKGIDPQHPHLRAS